MTNHRWLNGSLFVTGLLMTGCAAGAYSVQDIGQMHDSEYRAELTSTQPTDAITRCMMETLYSHADKDGKRPYTTLEKHSFGSTQAITIKSARNLANELYGIPTEILFLIENVPQAQGGTKSTVWITPYMLLGSQKWLDSIVGVVKACL